MRGLVCAVAPVDSALAAASRPGSCALATPGSCASLTGLSLPNTTINSAVDVPAGTVPAPIPDLPPVLVPVTCRVHAIVTNPGVNNRIGVDVWMPVSGWNGRFQGVVRHNPRRDTAEERERRQHDVATDLLDRSASARLQRDRPERHAVTPVGRPRDGLLPVVSTYSFTTRPPETRSASPVDDCSCASRNLRLTCPVEH
jgi:hypothetical protein